MEQFDQETLQEFKILNLLSVTSLFLPWIHQKQMPSISQSSFTTQHSGALILGHHGLVEQKKKMKS